MTGEQDHEGGAVVRLMAGDFDEAWAMLATIPATTRNADVGYIAALAGLGSDRMAEGNAWLERVRALLADGVAMRNHIALLHIAYRLAAVAFNDARFETAVALFEAALLLGPTQEEVLRGHALALASLRPGKVFTVGITTFDLRFERFFKPLIRSIHDYCPGIEVVVCVNGNHGAPFNETYRRELLRFCADYPNVFPTVFTEFRSLCKMWNTILVNASNDHVLMLNDDVTITDARLFSSVARAINLNEHTFKLNNSWSHIVMKRSEIDALGYFDERLLGIGEEDTDMEYRYSKAYDGMMGSFSCPYIINEFSDIRQDNIKAGVGKYSAFNRDFVTNVKYQLGENGAPTTLLLPSEQLYPYERFFWENRHRL